jgi:hypothetical protein
MSTTAGQFEYGSGVAWEDPVGSADIARRLGVQRLTVVQWRKRGLLPEPKGTASGAPLWDWPDIEAWARATGRLNRAG